MTGQVFHHAHQEEQDFQPPVQPPTASSKCYFANTVKRDDHTANAFYFLQKTDGHVHLSNFNPHRRTLDTSSQSKIIFPCDKCDNEFKSFVLLSLHKATTHGRVHKKDAIPCPHCNRVYRTKSKLLQHLPKHSDTRPYVRSHCGRAYNHKQGYKNHVCRFWIIYIWWICCFNSNYFFLFF